MEQATNIALRKYVDLFYRKKYLLIWLILISLPIGLSAYLRTPKVYQSVAMLTFKPSNVNPNPMAVDAQERQLREIVGTTSQLLVSRTNLEEMIKKFNLYPQLVAQRPIEDVIDVMRRDIIIQPANSGNTFQISYNGGDQSKVMKVVSELSGRFIEISNAGSVEEAVRIASYTEGEMMAAKSVMDAKDQAMRDYKRKYFDEMPDQRPENVQRMVSLQEQYRKNQDAILTAQQTMTLLQEQLQSLRQRPSTEVVAPNPQGGAPVLAPVDPLERLQNQLQDLLRKYTENHPEVKRVRAQIAKMQAEPRSPSETEPSAPGQAPAPSRPKPGDSVTSRIMMQYEAQIRNYELQIASLTRGNEDVQKQILQLQKAVDAAPIREAEWSSLTRDYSVMKQQYDRLVEKNLQAQSALNQARRQQSGQFRIEDPARFPETPFKPDFKRIMGACFVFSGGLGIAIAALSFFFDQSFRIPADLENYLKLPVVSVVSYIPTAREKKQDRIMFLVKALSLLFAGMLVMGYFAWAWHMEKIVI
ncbi:MAG: hypothetical protein LBU39_02465 [Desulfobulbaceae bacterium]|jgi:polysaccharide chain length determinant protein (PEP-CTERM system associated)|nr:hypothetical protein [Desulfobulbaceae bacterium]